MKAKSAFTLIELLIVVAIIAILAGIAVPNFLEAQVRSKVARTESDLRAIATGLEMYRVDNTSYPVATLFTALPDRLKGITTPIAYITSIPEDPFFLADPTNVYGVDEEYVYASGNIYFGSSNLFNTPEYKAGIWSLGGRGPDMNINIAGYCMAHPNAYRSNANVLGLYDPTNGTVSEGDIVRLSPGTLGRP
jgi:type II secretion system protein G